ncbi:RNA recognition motif domain [Dillenia turbinata]|uniref:RNA recognition motif domain n=1 Tax=Dillenia turbinata TaxID=194707 RepID=A0AAN8W3A5_9MAGN
MAEEEEEKEAEGEEVIETKWESMSREERRRAIKKRKRKQLKTEMAVKRREEQEARLNDPEWQMRIKLEEEEEAKRLEIERIKFEESEKLWIEAMEEKKKEEEEEARGKSFEQLLSNQVEDESKDGLGEGEDWDYFEEGPAEIIWQGNEIIVKKKKVKVPKKAVNQSSKNEVSERPTSNPLPPQSEAYADYKSGLTDSTEHVFDNVSQQIPNFGTEQDKAHCPFHIKTGACRFGQRCSRIHLYPDKACTLLMKNMYNGPGVAWEQDEGLEHTDEEVEHYYEEFYEDVHTEFLKFGEIVNFKVCKNGSFHLRGNVYVQYKSLDSAMLAYHSMNGRYFAGRQITCEYVGVTRWKVAICGEYMKSRLKTCSRGTACNFIHCFRNPGGDYEWADWDKPPPRHWVKKMIALFGFSDESAHRSRSMSGEKDHPSCNSSRRHEDEDDRRNKNHHGERSYSGKLEKDLEETRVKHDSRIKKVHGADSDGNWSDMSEYKNSWLDHMRRSLSKRSEVSKTLHDQEHREDRSPKADSNEYSEEEERDTRCNHRRKRLRHSDDTRGYSDDRADSKHGTQDTDSDGEWSKDRDRDNSSYKSKRKRPKEWSITSEMLDYKHNVGDISRGLSDSKRDRSPSNRKLDPLYHHTESTKKSKYRSHKSKGKHEAGRLLKHSHSDRREHSSKETTAADFTDEDMQSNGKHESSRWGSYSQKSKSGDSSSRFSSDETTDEVGNGRGRKGFSDRHRRSRRNEAVIEKHESENPS